MNLWYPILIILSVIILFLIIFGLPRKKNTRSLNIEGLDSPEVAKAFDKMTDILPFRILRKKIISHIRKLNPSGRLIDVGCGPGNLIVQLAKELPTLELIGVDISNEILERAKIRATKHERKIEFKEGSVENLPFPNEYADFIISTLSLHHWINPDRAFQEIYRVLKKEGIALIFDFRRDSRKFYYGFLTFVTNIVAPKALKNINEPIGSLKSSYTPLEVQELTSKEQIKDITIKPMLAWMFVQINKH